MQYAAWNTLHDGCVELIEGDVPGNVTVRVGIEYLTDELPTKCDYISVHLLECSRFEYAPYDGVRTTDLLEIANYSDVILDSELKDGFVVVNGNEGMFLLVYRYLKTYLAEGRLLPQDELEEAAHRYWTKWEERHR